MLLCPSGTDALLTATLLLARERPGRPMTAILPEAAESGAGVPLAVTCRRFDGPDAGVALAPGTMRCVHVPLRDPTGRPHDPAAIDTAFRRALAAAPGACAADP